MTTNTEPPIGCIVWLIIMILVTLTLLATLPELLTNMRELQP